MNAFLSDAFNVLKKKRSILAIGWIFMELSFAHKSIIWEKCSDWYMLLGRFARITNSLKAYLNILYSADVYFSYFLIFINEFCVHLGCPVVFLNFFRLTKCLGALPTNGNRGANIALVTAFKKSR